MTSLFLCARERTNVVSAETKNSQDPLVTTSQHYPLPSEKYTKKILIIAVFHFNRFMFTKNNKMYNSMTADILQFLHFSTFGESIFHNSSSEPSL